MDLKKKIMETREKLNEMMVHEPIDYKEVLSLSNQLDKLINLYNKQGDKKDLK